MNARNLRGDTFEFNPVQSPSDDGFLDLIFDAEDHGIDCVTRDNLELDMGVLQHWPWSSPPDFLSDDDMPF